MFNIGFSELIVVLLIAFLVVGPKDLPKVASLAGPHGEKTETDDPRGETGNRMG